MHSTHSKHPQRLVREMTTFDALGCLATIGVGLPRPGLGLERLKRGVGVTDSDPLFMVPARRLSPPCPRTAGEQQGNYAQDLSLRHHPQSLVQYAG